MSSIVEKFGAYVGNQVADHPERARKLLLTAYKGKRIQLKHFPNKNLSPARDELAVYSMNAIIEGIVHPERTALVSIFTPCELIQAFDIHPLLAEAMSSYINGATAEAGFVRYAHEAGVPETFCSYHKILLGAFLSDVLPKPKMVVNTSLACDANNLTFRTVAEHFQIPRFYIDVPYASDEDAVQYVAHQFEDLATFMEDQTGRKLDMEKLKTNIATADRSMKYLASAQRKKAGKYLSNDLTDELYEVFANHVLLGTPQIESFAKHLDEEIDSYPPSRGVRLLWMHTIPYYQKSLRALMNFSDRCQIIACDMNFDEFCEMDPEKPFESMARRLVYDSFNGSSERRIHRALEMCEQLQVDGVVYFCHWGCKQTMGGAQNARKTLEDAGYPTLILDGDACDAGNSSNGQMSTRTEAFVEMLEKRKAKLEL